MNEEQIVETSPALKQENPFINLIFNIVLPTFILMKMSHHERLGPTYGLIVALAFPVVYWIYDYLKRQKNNFISILGFVSILLTGGLGLLKLSGFWFALKEAAIPGIIGLALLFSLRTKYPLVKRFLFNDAIVQVDRISQALREKGNVEKFEKLLFDSTYLIAFSFGLSSVLNFLLAHFLLKSPSGTPEFNEELGYMNAVSLPVIMISCSSIMMYALWRLIKKLKDLTDLDLESILRTK